MREDYEKFYADRKSHEEMEEQFKMKGMENFSDMQDMEEMMQMPWMGDMMYQSHMPYWGGEMQMMPYMPCMDGMMGSPWMPYMGEMMQPYMGDWMQMMPYMHDMNEMMENTEMMPYGSMAQPNMMQKCCCKECEQMKANYNNYMYNSDEYGGFLKMMNEEYPEISREAKKYLKKLMELDFTMLELNLYLDTHPEDQMAWEQFNKYASMRPSLLKKVEETYGPITTEVKIKYPWAWLNQPWPWRIDF